jgi:glycosyltransferase involved in cell wall biosynthesis
MDIEVIIPLRNPTEVLRKTVHSLATQTDANLRVLVSDNFSTKGQELIAEAIQELQQAGISVRRVQPPSELGRVEHWNWAHQQAEGDWLKPIFVGDWLEPNYIAVLRAALAANPQCRYTFAGYTLHRVDQPPLKSLTRWDQRFRSAEEMCELVVRFGMQFGPPSVAAYQRDAFVAAGGYSVALPICADSLLFCTLAAMFGGLPLTEHLCHFNIHEARFSTTLPGKQRDALRESITYYWLLGYHAWTERHCVPMIGFARLFARAFRDHYRALFS